jgi:ferredoxin-type protein NapH
MKTQKLRQRLRKAILIVSFLLLPVTINYISPVLIVMGASEGVINGSCVVFALLFLSTLVLGRAWCGWLCPAGGGQDVCFAVNDKAVRGGKLNWIKYFIWVPWMGLIVMMAIRAGGYHTINFRYLQPASGISTTEPADYIRLYAILGLIMLLSFLIGKRAMCHYVCWMAPFLILGTAVKNSLKLPSLHLRVTTAQCTNCKRCTQHCPMSLQVNGMVQQGSMKNSECVLCGECVDGCPQQVINYSFGSPSGK